MSKPSWIYKNPYFGTAIKDKDHKFTGTKKHNLSYLFFEPDSYEGPRVHVRVTIAQLEALLKEAKRYDRQVKGKQRFCGFFRHLGNISFFFPLKRRRRR